MTDRNAFTEVLREVAEIMRTAEVPMTEEEIMAYFSDMDLSEQQKSMVMDYLNNKEELDLQDALINTEEENGQTGIDADSENSKVLQAYMEDLSLLQTYNEEEIMSLYKKLFAGENDVIETITSIWLGKVLEIAKKYMDIHNKVEDLIQEGNIALLMRLNQLCGTPDCSDAEQSFEQIEEGLSRVVNKGIMDYISEWDSEKSQESRLVGKLSLLQEAENFLKEENGRTPSIDELAAYTNMPADEIRNLKEFVK